MLLNLICNSQISTFAFQIVENDVFPQNICTKCETALFEAFLFKQKSAKSHKLLRQILNIQDDDGDKSENEPQLSTTQRKTRSTQTSVTEHCSISKSENKSNHHNSKVDVNKTQDNENESNVLDDERIDDKVENVWFVENVTDEKKSEQQEVQIDQQLNDIDDLEIVFESPDEMSSQPSDNAHTVSCEHCNEYVKQRQLQTHLKQHTKVLPYILSAVEFFRCQRCHVIFPFIDNLFEHINNEQICEPPIRLLKDDICTDYQYLANDQPFRLYSASRDPESNTIACSQCVMNFDDLLVFQMHFEEEHLTNSDFNPDYLRSELSHSCGVCGNTFKTLQDALHHVYFHQADLPCLHYSCTQFFDSFSKLFSHFIKHPMQNLTENEIQCSYCFHVATNREDLKQHQRSSCAARNFICDICGEAINYNFNKKSWKLNLFLHVFTEKTFYKKSTLNMHLRTHTNDRKYACTMCPKAFLQSNDLANHVR